MTTISQILARLRRVPWLWKLLVKMGTRVGVSPQNWVLVETVSRPWWLYRSRGRLTLGKIHQQPPASVTDADIALCERLISAFAGATRDPAEQEASGSWAQLLDMHYHKLAEALERADAYDLAELLASMFRQKITSGFMMQADVSATRSWLGSRILSIKSLDALVSLAEALGAILVDGPEMRAAGLVFDESLATLLTRVDQRLGFRVAFPNIGAPFGLAVDGRLITLETPEQIYAAVRLDQAMRVHLERTAASEIRIVEIGGGYGGMAYWYMRVCPNTASYTIVDLPIMNVLQGYFLSRALGADKVSFCGEPPAQLSLLPNVALDRVGTPFNVLVNKDSMPEMPYEVMADYIEWGRLNCDGIFYSYNHEVGTTYSGHRISRVAEAIDRIGGFTRMSRDHSWLRRGYAEEIYKPTGVATQQEVA